MFKIWLIFGFFAITFADLPYSPSGIPCGRTPRAVFSCLANPKIVDTEISEHCPSTIPECERIRCVFEKAGWLDGSIINKDKLRSYLEEYKKENPVWATAVEEIKRACLSHDLPPQGVHMTCPVYDVMHCIFAKLLRHSRSSQWASSGRCEYARRFAAECIVCPDDCFAPSIPDGSCNACQFEASTERQA